MQGTVTTIDVGVGDTVTADTRVIALEAMKMENALTAGVDGVVTAVHVTVGIGLLAVMAWLASRNRFSDRYHTPVEVSGLYWHFVDIVWVFLFPLLYLIR